MEGRNDTGVSMMNITLYVLSNAAYAFEQKITKLNKTFHSMSQICHDANLQC